MSIEEMVGVRDKESARAREIKIAREVTRELGRERERERAGSRGKESRGGLQKVEKMKKTQNSSPSLKLPVS